MKYAIAGKGRSGRAAYDFLIQRGEQAVFLDDSDRSLTPENMLACEAVILSPGVPRTHVAVKAALEAGLPVLNEIDLAVGSLPDCKFVGITGTNGKSTTTALLGHIVNLWMPGSFVGGNLGRPLCEALTAGEKPRYGILELSSYQLETISKLKLDVAVLLNLSPDHLERYPSIEAYYETKRKIFDLLRPGGVSIPPLEKGGLGGFNASPKLLGEHNLQNMRAAILAAQALGVPDELIQQGLDTFPGIAHRLEILGTKNGVTWVNDSKSTTVDSTLAALACFKSGVHLILGGLGKGLPYEPIVQAARGKVKTVYAIGQDAPKILAAFPSPLAGEGQGEGSVVINAGNLQTACELAIENAKPGDTILLSPACASYDQFKNFEHRGEVFREIFNAL